MKLQASRPFAGVWLGLVLMAPIQLALKPGQGAAVGGPDSRLRANENETVGRWLKSSPSLRLAIDSDCTDREYLAVMRRELRADFDPYLARGDFNRDGREDLAVLVVDGRRSAEHGFAVAIFNGPFERASAPNYFENMYPDVGHSYLEWDHERRGRLFLGKYESDSVCVYFIPKGSGYRFDDCEARSKAEAKFDALVADLKAVDASNPALRQELLKMRDDDQLLRAEGQKLWEAKGPDSLEAKAVWERQGVLDLKNQARLKEIVATHGWPGAKLVGLSGADAAFLIAQHADLPAQKKYLPMLKTAVKRRDALPLWPAMLEDRVLVGEGKPQVFGTQLRMPPGSTKWQLCPIRDEAHVDSRRAEVGLGPLAEYLKDFGINYKPPKGK